MADDQDHIVVETDWIKVNSTSFARVFEIEMDGEVFRFDAVDGPLPAVEVDSSNWDFSGVSYVGGSPAEHTYTVSPRWTAKVESKVTDG